MSETQSQCNPVQLDEGGRTEPAAPRIGTAAAVRLDDGGRIVEDLPCPQCGYNLRTLMPAGECPECGLAVQRAVWVARLRWNDPAWLRAMATASAWFGIGVGCLLAMVAALYWLDNDYLLLVAGPIAVSTLATVIGCYQATAPNPDTLAREWFVSRRRLARWSIIGAVMGAFTGIAVTAIAEEAGGYIAAGAGMMIPVGIVLTLMHGRRTAAMIDQPALVWATRIYLSLFVLALGPAFLAVVLFDWQVIRFSWIFKFDRLLAANLGVGLESITTWAIRPIPLGLLALMSFPLMWGYHRRLRDAANMASKRLEEQRPAES